MENELTVESFVDLSIPKFTEKLKKVSSMKLLDALEKAEIETEGLNRKGALSAIAERRQELVDELVKSQGIEEGSEIAEEKGTTTDASGVTAEGPDNAVLAVREFLKDISLEDLKDYVQTFSDSEEVRLLLQEEVAGQSRLEFVDVLEIRLDELDTTDKVSKSYTEEDLIEAVKEKRIELDRILKFSQAHFRIESTPERSLFLSRCWLGKLLGSLGSENPYAGENKIEDRSKIPAAADVNDGGHFQAEIRQFTLVETFKGIIQLRTMLEEIIDWIDNLDVQAYGRNAAICRTQAYVHAAEAKFALRELLGKQKL